MSPGARNVDARAVVIRDTRIAGRCYAPGDLVRFDDPATAVELAAASYRREISLDPGVIRAATAGARGRGARRARITQD